MAKIKVQPTNKIEINSQKTWETVIFKATRSHAQGIETITVELEYNHETGKIRFYTPHQEMVSFTNDTIEQVEMKVKALNAAMDYLKTIVKKR